MPYEPMILGLKFEIRIADLTARDVLVVTCPACHWTANVAPHVLHSRYHEMRKLIHVQADMMCKRCGAIPRSVLHRVEGLSGVRLYGWVSGWHELEH